jgi:TPP-dependent pyruvate/acetoin dehydrogenase alpha subunit
MAAKELPKIRSGLGDVGAPTVEVWSDEDYRRATGLTTILSADGKADRAAVPALAPEVLQACYRTMLRIRALDEKTRAAAGDAAGELPPTTRGYEAAIVGAIAALDAGDIVVPGRRETSAALWRGHTVAALAAGQPIPRALGVLPGSPFRGTQLPHATGIAWAMKIQAKAQSKAAGAGPVTLAYLDRETTSAEDFHSGLNFAGVFRVPAVFVCINRGISGAADAGSVETVSETIAVKALGYGIPGVRVDGNDLFAVFAATQAAATRARSGGGPTLIEAVLSSKDDPFDRLRGWLVGQKVLDAAGETALRREVDAEVGAALKS